MAVHLLGKQKALGSTSRQGGERLLFATLQSLCQSVQMKRGQMKQGLQRRQQPWLSSAWLSSAVSWITRISCHAEGSTLSPLPTLLTVALPLIPSALVIPSCLSSSPSVLFLLLTFLGFFGYHTWPYHSPSSLHAEGRK